VAPDGTSSHVTSGLLNLTHRHGHADPRPLEPGQVYRICVQMKAAGYRFRPGHRIRLTVASAYWPVVFPSPYKAINMLHRSPDQPSHLILPVVSEDKARLPSPQFKTTPPKLEVTGSGREEPAVWQIVEDVIKRTVTVKLYDGGSSVLPDDTELFSSEMIEMTAHHDDPAHARLTNEVLYRLTERDYQIDIQASGTIRSALANFHIDIQLEVLLNGRQFWRKAWLTTVPRHLL